MLDEKAPFFRAEQPRGPVVDSKGLEFKFRHGVLFRPSLSGFSCAGRGEATGRTWAWSRTCHFPPTWVMMEGPGEPTECRTLPRT